MTLAELLEGKFRGDLRFRGAAYLKAERVSITRITPENLFAVIRDNNDIEFHTQLTRIEEQLMMYCNCPRCSKRQNKELACKYLWATILAVDDGELLSGSPKPGYIPPFAYEEPPNLFEADEDLTSDIYSPPEPSKRTAAPNKKNVKAATSSPTQPKARLRDWEQKLADLRKDMENSEPVTTRAKNREREIFYEIDLEESRSVKHLVVQTSQRQRRANGQWGKLKPLKLRAGQLDDIELADDRKILAYLSGSMPERTNWVAQQAEIQTAVYRYRVPYELCELILPLMCATNRVRFITSRESDGGFLTWDDGPAWDLCLRVFHDETNDDWRMSGELQREDIKLPTSEAVLLLPGGLVITDREIARLRDFEAFNWVNLVAKEDAIKVAAGEERELVDYLLDMPTLPKLELPEELRLEEIQCDPVPHLVVHTPQNVRWQMERLQAEVAFDYLETLIPGNSSQWAIVQREEGRCILRNQQAEFDAWARLNDLGFRRYLDHRRGGYDVEIAARELGRAVRELIAEGWEVRADGKQVHQPSELNFRVKSDIDWFELHADVDFDGQTIGFPELLAALGRGDTTIRLDDGSLGILPEEWLKQYGLLAGLGETDGDHLKFSANQISLLDALLAAQDHVQYDARFTELSERFRSFSGIEAAEEMKTFQGELRGYQREGLGWLKFLQEFHFGGCLADDMGLGKTVQLLALLQQHYKGRTKKNPSLIVVPKSLMFNWRKEGERFTPKLSLLEYVGLNRAQLRDEFSKHQIILTTYGTLRRDIMELKDIPFEYVVLDEAQTIKNSASQVAKASRLLNSQHRVALSGTPIENHLGDLWSIFEFLNPNMLGRSSVFKACISDMTDTRSREMLSQGLQPFILRRTKQQVASELPDKIEQTIYCDMPDAQQELYEELRDHYRQSLLGIVEEQGLGRSKMHVLEALLRLRQAACHPGLLDDERKQEASAKLDVLTPYLQELIDEGHKALVFSQFTSMLSIVKDRLDENGIVYEYLDGQTRDRQERVERFQTDEKCGVFLISLKAGGLGLNLTAADYVFLLDPWWNPAVEAQAIDRAHRVGQTRQVFAYRLICRDTVEEKIAELQTHKRSLADAILQADNTNVLRDLSPEDLEMLLS